MTDKLTEALAEMSVESAIGITLGWFADDRDVLPDDVRIALTRLIKASRRWASFPTDEDVEAMRVWLMSEFTFYERLDDPYGEAVVDARAALEAVKREDR